jgi:hypothetical protein
VRNCEPGPTGSGGRVNLDDTTPKIMMLNINVSAAMIPKYVSANLPRRERK